VSDDQRPLRCAIYTRKSSEEGLEQAFNSLDAQREACEAYILSQRHEGWQVLATRYDDGGYSGGNTDRPALKNLMQDIESGKIDLIVVYKVDRLTRALGDFAKMVDLFDAKKVSFVSITQQFNTTTSMGRLTLNVLLSFAQFEREVTGERIRDKIAASKKKGMWMGGRVPVGYDWTDRKLIINSAEAEHVRHLFQRYIELGNVSALQIELAEQGILSKVRVSRVGNTTGGVQYSRGALYELLQNRVYIGEIVHRDQHYPGEHAPIISMTLWEKAQAIRLTNLQGKHSGIRSKEPSLLIGLVFDQYDRRLTPSHTNKKGKRYRYYVTSSNNAATDVNDAVRIPAQDLENLVVSQLHRLLRDSYKLLDMLCGKGESARDQNALLQAAIKWIANWSTVSKTAQRQILKSVIQRVTVSENDIHVVLNCSALRVQLIPNEITSVDSVDNQGTPVAKDHRRAASSHSLTIDARMVRRGLEMRLVIADDGDDEPLRMNQSLIKAIARGRHWYEQLISMNRITLTELAAESGVNDQYASRILRAAFIAPDIVEAILEGKQPSGMTLNKLLDNLPLDWCEQRRLLNC
jgi:site-specific DNA recombinase